MKIILIRHVETEGNVLKRFNGVSESPMTPRGNEMEKILLNVIKKLNNEIHIDKIYTSETSRAFITAEKISLNLNIPLIKESNLKEFNFGIFEGLTFKEAENLNSKILYKWLNNYLFEELPQGDSFFNKTLKIKNWLDTLISNNKNNIIIFSHGATIRSIICSLLDLPIESSWHFKIELGNLAIIDYNNKFGRLEKLNLIDYNI